MPKAQITETVNINPNLLAFRPRQVVLLCKPPSPSPTPTMKTEQNDSTNIKTLILKPEQKALLFHSIAKYLERSGFSKTLKKFRSEAKIQNDDFEDSSFDLEEMFCKFLEMCNQVSKNLKSHKEQELQTDGISRKDGEGEGKKKKSHKSTGDKPIDSKNDGETIDDAVPVGEKSKEKKRNKKNSISLDKEAQVSTKVLQEPVEDGKKVIESKIDDKPKDKKKKKNKLSSDPIVDEGKPNKSDSKAPKEDISDKESKGSKKRKRMASEDVVQAADENLVEESKHRKTEESKRRKTEGSEEPKIQEQSVELNSSNITEEKAWQKESSNVGYIESQKKSVKQINEQSNGSFEENGEKSAMRKTIKQQNGSAEPKTVKHFQRVKVEDVVFSDERLKDNSYWAKDGADSGYGAKAQDVLGQVRGRDFRHEKTKKKRGSYRGGQIDLHSHSVKFNYSDED